MACIKLLRRLSANEEGASIVEFAIVSTVFFMMMLSIIEYGMILMTKVAIESVAQEVSRSGSVNATIPGCAANDRLCVVTTLVQQKTMGLVNPAYISVTSTVVSAPTTPTPPVPDLCLDTYGTPHPPTCTTFLDNNGVAGYQQASASTAASVGNASDLVEIRISYNWQIMFPLMKPFFKNGQALMSSTTVVRNEPS